MKFDWKDMRDMISSLDLTITDSAANIQILSASLGMFLTFWSDNVRVIKMYDRIA